MRVRVRNIRLENNNGSVSEIDDEVVVYMLLKVRNNNKKLHMHTLELSLFFSFFLYNL